MNYIVNFYKYVSFKNIGLFITIPIVLVMIAVSLLTTPLYLNLSEGLYDSHDDIDYDYEYVSNHLMGYLNYQYKELDVTEDADSEILVYTTSEISHMKDVLKLFTLFRILGLISLIVMSINLIYLIKNKETKALRNCLTNIWFMPLCFTIVFGVACLIDFGSVFGLFHEIFFYGIGNWGFAYDSALILMLPLNFWLVSVLLILLFLVLSIVAISIISYKKMESDING